MDFDPTLKKKKKKKVVLEDEDGVEAATEGMDDLNVDDDGFGEKKKKKKSKDKDKDADPEEDFGKKKKKKKKKDVDDEDGEDADAGEATNSGSGLPWDGTRAITTTTSSSAESLASSARRTRRCRRRPRRSSSPAGAARGHEEDGVRQPDRDLQRDEPLPGARDPVHDGRARNVWHAGRPATADHQGRFLPKVFEGVLRHYFIDYVICNLCKSANTTLDRDKATRLSICKCNACGASRSVSAIQKGFRLCRGASVARRAKPRDLLVACRLCDVSPLLPLGLCYRLKRTFVPSRSA